MPSLHIITNRYPAYEGDPASPFVRDFALAVARSGVTVEITTPGYTVRRESPKEISINWLPWSGNKEVLGAANLLNPFDLSAVLRFVVKGRARILRTLRDRPADHCLALWALPSGWFALQAKRRLGIRYSVWCLGSDIYVWAKKPVIGALTKTILSEADHLFADAQDLCAEVENFSGRECRFLPSLRLLPDAKPLRPRAEGPGRRAGESSVHRPFQFLYVGRLERAKGVFVALNAFATARRRLPRIVLSFLGWGPDEARLKTRSRELGLESSVTFCGKGGPEDVARLMRGCDCLIIPSFSDSIPLVFGEALQTGIPLLVTDIGDMGSLTRQHSLGRVVDPGDIDGMAAAMVEMALEGPPAEYTKRMRALVDSFHPQVAAGDFIASVFSASRPSSK